MKIAILAWGSLINNNSDLSLNSEFIYNGPILPLEFSRVSSSGDKKGCLTLVIDKDNGQNNKVFYAESSLLNLSDAITELGIREKISQRISIGYINRKNQTINKLAFELYPEVCYDICDWADENGYEGVIWTGFRANFEKMTNQEFNIETAINHLDNLSYEQKEMAYSYIYNTPQEIQTSLRSFIENI